MTKLFLSHRLEILVEHLAKEIANDGLGIFVPRIIIVPNGVLKQWILIQIAKESDEKGIAGYHVLTLQEALAKFTASSGFTEIFCSLYEALTECQSQEIRSYLEPSPKRHVELATHLTTLMLRYGSFCPSLFELDPTTEEWQKQLIQKLFVLGTLRLPVQITPLSMPSLHCFGFDYLPKALWELFNFNSVYLFSPCFHFWEDICTDWERKKLDRYWRKKGASPQKREELGSYLKSAPPLLANWGKVGRETLKILDSIVEESEEDYRPCSVEQHSTLARLRRRLLSFSVDWEGLYSEDASIQISKSGSSLLREVEHLRLSILRLIEKEGLSCSDIAVLAPDIQPYLPLIQLVFSDLPFRISGLEIGSRSFFYQGMHRLFTLDFHPEDLMALFENPSFSRARDWSSEILEQFREWMFNNKGLETELLDQFVYLFPEETRRISSASADVLEQYIEIYQSLRSDVALFQHPRTLLDWANHLTTLIEKYFSVDVSDEADAASWSFFLETMKELREIHAVDRLFPFAPIQALLKRPVSGGQIHSSHLHAIRFGSFSEGSLTPVRALFLIGMDEEKFPQRFSTVSLDLLRNETIYSFDAVDQDRYLFLQALFAAKEFIHFSYAHVSSEGNPVNPSPLIEELIRNLDAPVKEHTVEELAFSGATKAFLDWPEHPALQLPEGEYTISLSDLSSLARHPWEFYLKKQLGILLDPSKEESFSLQKAKILKAQLVKPLKDLLFDLPSGVCGQAMKMDMEEISSEWAELMRAWQVFIEPCFLRICSRQKKQNEQGWELPSLKLEISTGLRVQIIGEVKNCSTKGFVHSGQDTLEGLLRVWPECLAALVAMEQQEIYCLKSGKIRSVNQPEQALRAYILYYFLSQSAPSPLLSDWADSLLRKGPTEWEKRMRDKMLGKGSGFEDPVWDWVVDRVRLPPAVRWFSHWGSYLREHFTELSALYPFRGKNAVI